MPKKILGVFLCIVVIYFTITAIFYNNSFSAFMVVVMWLFAKYLKNRK